MIRSMVLALLFGACSSPVVISSELPPPPPVAGVRSYVVIETWLAGVKVLAVRAGCTAGLAVGIHCGADPGGE